MAKKDTTDPTPDETQAAEQTTPSAAELSPEEQLAWQRCVELSAQIEVLEAEKALFDITDPQTREDLLAVRVAIEDAIPSSRYLSGNQVDSCLRIKTKIDAILALPLPEPATEPDAPTTAQE